MEVMDGAGRQELVKVVVVGDNGVGKTRLVCARAYLQSVPLSQLVKTHVPTIWAIDQYRIYKDVLEKSVFTVDEIEVSLRLWDTFGDHHKDRRFAYEKSDVILLCYDITRTETLQNCRTFWHQQIQKFCPDTPILLVGCKNDLRYMHTDAEYIKYCLDRKPFVRQVFEKDIILPHEGRYLAQELGAPYYEASVYTFFGVEEVFENAVRAALCSRRAKRFWKTNLKNITKPLMQEPFCPPRPPLPEDSVTVSNFPSDLTNLFNDGRNTDVIFVCSDSRGVSGHKFVLAATCPLLCKLFSLDISRGTCPESLEAQVTKSKSLDSILHVKFGSSTVCPSVNSSYNLQSFVAPESTLVEHTRSLYRQSEHARSGSNSGGRRRTESVILGPGIFRQLQHPAFTSLHLQQCVTEDEGGRVYSSLQTVVSCRKIITLGALQAVLRYLYTGTIVLDFGDLQRVLHLAELLELQSLHRHLTDIPHLGNIHEVITQAEDVGAQLEAASSHPEDFHPDVVFELEDGQVAAHKAILAARSDVMAAMFSENFLEGAASVVTMPGIQRSEFLEVTRFLYTDQAPRLTRVNCLLVLELANRLVLPRLISLIERTVINGLGAEVEVGAEFQLEALELLEAAQMFNAAQLAAWCLGHIGQHYAEVVTRFPRRMRGLSPDNQARLNLMRWPPLWYIKDYEIYERFIESLESERERTSIQRKRKRTSSGCMCFSSEAPGTWSSYNISGLAPAPPPPTNPSFRSQNEE